MKQGIDLKIVQAFVDKLNVIEQREHARKGFTFPTDVWYAKPRHKFIALDCHTAGAFLVENKTGEIYNIKGYGQADYNKKAKANLGNILTADPELIHSKRWNYLK